MTTNSVTTQLLHEICIQQTCNSQTKTKHEMKTVIQAAKFAYNKHENSHLSFSGNRSSNRLINSTTKEKPTNQDIDKVNEAIKDLMKQINASNAPDPSQNPSAFLWLANCVIL